MKWSINTETGRLSLMLSRRKTCSDVRLVDSGLAKRIGFKVGARSLVYNTQVINFQANHSSKQIKVTFKED